MADDTETGATTGEETVEVISMEDALGSALDALDTDGKPAETDASTADPEETVEHEETEETDGERDEKGRFKAKAGKEGEPPEGEGEPPEGEQAGEGEQPTEQIVDGRDIAKAPTTWKPEAQAEYAKLPETVRKEIHKREEDFHRGIEQYRGAAQFGQDIAKEFQPYQKMLESIKVAPSQMVNAALQFEYQIRTGTPEQKLDLMHRLAKAYGVNLDGSATETDDENAEIIGHPFFQQLKQELDGVKSQLTAREQREKEEAEKAEQAERERIRNDIAAFQSDSKNEFYGQVKGQMLQLIQSGQATDLKDAYDKAVWINPEVRAKLIARQQETERKETEKAERAAKARKAANLNVAPRATPPGKATGKGTMEEALGSALDEALAS